ncbi:MAG: hypothetical protein IID36_02750 [Planctomycetes bacterium]|nr:hypothetical protein [Planctomycetota bacterium]
MITKRQMCHAIAIAAISTLMGCASPIRVDRNHARGNPNLLFNPHLMFVRGEYSYRSEWPVSMAYHSQQESVTYREVIYDRQGDGFGFNQGDRYSRRFEMTRRGRAHR